MREQAKRRAGSRRVRRASATGRRRPFRLATVTVMLLAGGAQAQAAVNPPSKVYVYGHSFTLGKGPTNIGLPYPYADNPYGGVIAAHYGAAVDYNGRSRTVIVDAFRAVVAPTFDGTSGRRWAVGPGSGDSVVTVQNLLNDQGSTLGGDPAYLRAAGGALRGIIGATSARSRSCPPASSGWVLKSYPDRSPCGVLGYTTRYGARMTFRISGSTAMVVLAAADSSRMTYGTLRVRVNGTTWVQASDTDAGYWHGTGKMRAYADSVDRRLVRTWSLFAIRLTGMPAGYNTLELEKVDNTTLPVWVGGVYQTSGTPPQVYLATEPPRNPGATCQPCVVADTANRATYAALEANICGQYLNCHLVDLSHGWDNSTMVALTDPDGAGPLVADALRLHPNHLGMNQLASTYIDAIDAAQ